MSELYISGGVLIEDVLADHGVYASVVRGVSMMPLLRAGRDVVCILPITSPPKKYDVLLYKREGRYILHRVIGFFPDGYIIRGDNTYKKEYVKNSDLVGTLASFKRGGREYSTGTRGFYRYAALVQFLYPLRYCIAMPLRALARLARKIIKKK